MKVKITYGVKLEDVPGEVENLSVNALNNLVEMIRKTKLQQRNVQQQLELIEYFRNALVDVDSKLEDCYNILKDYQEAIAQLEETSVQNGNTDEPEIREG
jgi:hypothetical protein